MAKGILDEHGLETAMALLIGHTNAKVAEARVVYDTKFNAMISNINEIARDMDSLSASVDTRLTGVEMKVDNYTASVTAALNNISNQITALGTNLNNKIDSLQQDFDNLDTQVNTLNQRVTDLSNSVDERFSNIEQSMGSEDTSIRDSIKEIAADVATIKDAMGNMIINIKPDGNGQFDVYHYNGSITHNTMVEEISDEEIDNMLKFEPEESIQPIAQSNSEDSTE